MPPVAPSILIAACLLVSGGCASVPGGTTSSVGTDPHAIAPADFSIDLTILTGRGMRDRTEPHLRQSRFVLFPDGSLHYGADNEQGPGWLPNLARRLTRAQMTDVWSVAREAGFADPGIGAEPTNLHLIHPAAGEVAYLIAFTGDGERWMFQRSATGGGGGASGGDAASVDLIRTLAGLAWSTDWAAGETMLAPRRYDFGPDPYARYRSP